MDKMETKDSVLFRKSIEMENSKSVYISVDFYSIRGEQRDRIGELVDQFLDSVVEILKEEIS